MKVDTICFHWICQFNWPECTRKHLEFENFPGEDPRTPDLVQAIEPPMGLGLHSTFSFFSIFNCLLK